MKYALFLASLVCFGVVLWLVTCTPFAQFATPADDFGIVILIAMGALAIWMSGSIDGYDLARSVQDEIAPGHDGFWRTAPPTLLDEWCHGDDADHVTPQVNSSAVPTPDVTHVNV